MLFLNSEEHFVHQGSPSPGSPAFPRAQSCAASQEWLLQLQGWVAQRCHRVPCVTRRRATSAFVLSLELSQPLLLGNGGSPGRGGSPCSPAPPDSSTSMGRVRICRDSWQAACSGMRVQIVKGPSETVCWQIPVITILIHLL